MLINKLKKFSYYLIHDINKIKLYLLYKFNWIFSNDEIYIKYIYKLRMKQELNLCKPRTFGEKLQWLKLYNRNPEYTRMVDKYEVKKYVADIIGEEYVIPTLGVWDKVEDIDYDALPNQFVLKSTHDSGGIVICKNKSLLDRVYVKKKIGKSLKRNYYNEKREWPYKYVKRRIIAEQFLSDSVHQDLIDYKFFCFNGQPRYCQVIRDRSTNETIDFYDMQWNHMPFVGLNPIAPNEYNPIVKNGLNPVTRPSCLDNMIEICEKLAKNIPFVRIDLYIINNKIYFGEITFFPASGFGVFTPDNWNLVLGDMISLPNIKNTEVEFIK
ncbi:MAG: hypothetical protein IJ442_03365 [Bacteroidaceae bacterium]|nr:hypothetical protein [Bacteroidaceae bacterium]